jgi:hypothetical protein
MTKKNYLYSFFVILSSLWWGWTLLVDMFIIRTVFAIIDNFFQAGDLGVAVFSKLNNLELIVGTFLVVILAFQVKRNRKAIPLLIIATITWTIAMSYFSFLTPKLVYLTELWKRTDLIGISSVSGIADVQQEHQFYHSLYIGLDSLKLLLLSVLIFFGVWKQEKMF